MWFTEDEIEPCIWDGKEKYVEYRNDGSWVVNIRVWDTSDPNNPVVIHDYKFK